MTTKITPSVLENTTVVAATHGTAASIPVIVVDPQGRITGVTNTSISIATSQIGSGTLADARLPAQADLTAANYYGDATKTVAIVTDAKGRIKSAANVTIAIASSAVSGLATSATTDTTNADNIGSGTLATARLADSGVVARTYGTASSVSQVVVDAKGRITGISNVAIQIATSQITSYPTFAASATTDTTNATNIGSGTLPDARLSNAGVNTGTFGSASVVPRIAVDAKGRVTGVTATNIAIGVGAVSGLATVATSGAYGDLSGRPTIPTIPASLPASDVYAWAKTATKPSYAYSEISSTPAIPTTLPASDVYAWAKAATKPSYAYSEISSTPTNVSSFSNDSGFLTASSFLKSLNANGYIKLPGNIVIVWGSTTASIGGSTGGTVTASYAAGNGMSTLYQVLYNIYPSTADGGAYFVERLTAKSASSLSVLIRSSNGTTFTYVLNYIAIGTY
jgi:hypothetical protein